MAEEGHSWGNKGEADGRMRADDNHDKDVVLFRKRK